MEVTGRLLTAPDLLLAKQKHCDWFGINREIDS